MGLWLIADGDVYVAMDGARAVVRVWLADGRVTTVARSPAPWPPPACSSRQTVTCGYSSIPRRTKPADASPPPAGLTCSERAHGRRVAGLRL